MPINNQSAAERFYNQLHTHKLIPQETIDEIDQMVEERALQEKRDDLYHALVALWGDPQPKPNPESSDDLAIPALAETIYTGYMTELTHGKGMFPAWISLPQEYKVLWLAAANAAYLWKSAT